MTVFVNAIMYYKVKDATLAVSNVDDYSGSSRLLAATTLRKRCEIIISYIEFNKVNFYPLIKEVEGMNTIRSNVM